ncbi:hydantoinase/oxoprolinase family protein [Brucella pseudogrignonensis]|uniref:hydantoinase/oxoprolinase family protein n=1 Tax=Brucella pseudogrignonensis TaxID=419475 RepID=UPI0028B33F53|nr:hydantoinase/oxoprolinase family protein [Brucella pseudogrignonensis]MDT6942436.1 hydantoinase/oxoprolinase family protein [Brucella pseudogrignonensis]
MTKSSKPPFNIAVDVGGTFTDLVLRDSESETLLFKSLTTPNDLSEGIFNGLDLMSKAVGMTIQQMLAACSAFACGTTAATNAILEGKTAKTALLCTEGFRDVLSIRSGGRHGFSIQEDFPLPYIPRSLTFPIRERVNAEGQVEVELDLGQAREQLAACAKHQPEAVAVALLWSHINPEHERALGMLIADILPGVPYSLSHQVNPVMGEYKRTSATAIDASLKPVLKTQISALEDRLSANGFAGQPTFVCSNGGRTSSKEITEKPVYLCLSGPSTAPAAACRLAARSGVTHGNIITIDVGGTSLDASIARGGRVAMHREGSIAGHVFGVPSIDVATVGSGGGSIAWVDAGGMLRVGPESAGSFPGPACYGRGGDRPTLTDANLVRGLLDPTTFADGQMTLSVEKARAAIERDVATPLGVSIEEAASLIAAVTEQDMVAAIEELAIKRGFDPREFLLVSGGGAGGLHAARLARELGMREVLFPHAASVLCAYGTATGDIKFDFSVTRVTSSRSFDFNAVRIALDDLKKEGTAFLDRMGVDPFQRELRFTVDAHYQGQVSYLTVDVPSYPSDAAGLKTLVEEFHAEHQQNYSVHAPEDTIEFVAWSVEAVGVSTESARTIPSKSDELHLLSLNRKRTTIDPVTRSETSISLIASTDLNPGDAFRGPALIEDRLTSLFVPERAIARVTADKGILVEL